MPRKTVAIRGLDLDLYHEIFSLAKKDGKRVADFVNIALESFLKDENNGYNSDILYENNGEMNNGGFILRNDGEISLSKRDINDLKKAVGSFRIENTGKITFEKDIDKSTLKKIDKVVIHSGTVEIPKTIYPQLLMISEIHGKLEKY